MRSTVSGPAKRDERGQVTVMIVGFAFILMVLIAVVTDASAAYLQHSGLDTVADGAALTGADNLNEASIYEGGVGEEPPLDPDRATAAIEKYLQDTGAYSRYPGLHVRAVVKGNQVTVHVTARLDLPLNVPGVQDTATIGATGSAITTPGG
jgi:Flp pilus assembly protein TadG